MTLAEQNPCRTCGILEPSACNNKDCMRWRSWFLSSWGLTAAMFPGPREPKVIQVEGYKAFSGLMKWVPGNPEYPSQRIYGDWLYKPDTDCWYCNGISYPADTCEVLEVF